VMAVLLATSARTTCAEWEIGLAAQTGWSNNDYLGNPDGWSLFFSKSLTDRLDVRGAYNRFENTSHGLGTLPLGFGPGGTTSVRQLISGNAEFYTYELWLNYAIVDGSRMRLELGGGMGPGDASVSLYGEETGKTVKGANDGLAVAWNVQVLVKELFHSPAALRLAYQYRRLAVGPQPTDGFEPFAELSLSSVQLALLARF
jgi:hypothetical protein